MKVQKIKLNDHHFSWLVLDEKHLPIKPVTQFIKHLDNIRKSPFTIKNYAHYLKLFFEYILLKNIIWQEIKLSDVSNFIGWLKRIKKSNLNIVYLNEPSEFRKASSINVMLGCITSFYKFHNQMGNTDVQLEKVNKMTLASHKPLLHHVFKDKLSKKRLITLKEVKQPPKTLTQEQVKKLLSACTNYRDLFLINLLCETGLRIGQALSLRHEDVVCWDNVINIRYRLNNINNVRNKTYTPNQLHVSSALMGLYSDYISSLEQARLNEYVFINLDTYHPLAYPATKKMFIELSRKCGFYARPHMLRHTHASALLKAGWDMAYIQKRLGHASVQTTINTYSHIDNDDMKKAFNLYLESEVEAK